MSNPQIKNVIFPYSVLHIQLDTNTGKDGESSVHLFKRTMIKMPKMDVPPIFNSEYPFFTKNVRYPRSLESADWKTKYEFFFNRQIFLNRLNKVISDNESNFIKPVRTKDEITAKEYYDSLQEIEKDNVMITLRCLFPIPEVFGKTLKNTYDHILTSKPNERVFKDINVLSAFNIFGFMYKFGIVNKEKHEYFINVGGKRYMVDNVVWENDMVNHPVYKKFLLAQRNVYEEVENNKFNIEQRKEIVEEELLTLLNRKTGENAEVDDGANEVIKNREEIIKIIDSIQTVSSNSITAKDLQLLELFKDDNNIKLHHSTKSAFKTYINTKLLEIEVLSLYLKTDETKTDIYNSLDRLISGINKQMATEPKDAESNKKLLESVYELIKYFEENKETDLKDILKNKDYANLLSQKKNKSEAKKISKSKNLSDKPLLDSFKNRAQSNLNEYDRTSQSFQLQQFRSSVKTIEKLLNDVLLGPNITPLRKAEKLISIQDEIEQFGKQNNTSQPEKTFFESSEIPYYKQLIKTAIQVKAASIVYDFVENNTPMNLSNTEADGKTNISNTMRDVNDFITKNYTTEVRINNKLSSNTTKIYEPIRKTSNRELYEVIRLFKVGEKILRAKNRSLTDEQIEKYKQVINDIYEEYVLEIKAEDDDIYNRYLYVGTDDVNINESADTANPNDASAEIKKNVKEIYVQFDLVDADTFEKTSRSSCKLYDRELADEFLYLADPSNKNNRSLSRFRNLDFNSVIPESVISAVDPNSVTTQPAEKKGGYTRRIRSANKTLRKYTV